jgi:hypothetical protein
VLFRKAGLEVADGAAIGIAVKGRALAISSIE